MSIFEGFRLLYLLALAGNAASYLLCGGEICATELDSTLATISATLDKVRRTPEQIDVEVAFGALLTKANLQWALDRLESRFGEKHFAVMKIQDLLAKCGMIVDEFWSYNPDGIEWLPSFLDKGLWYNSAEDLIFDGLNVQQKDLPNLNLRSCSSINNYLYKGSLKESYRCITELFSLCAPSFDCWRYETEPASLAGYRTSQRLLYFIVANRLECDEKNSDKFFKIQQMKKDLCFQILKEAKGIEKKDFPIATRGLFLQQVAFCGLDGHVEFGQERWRLKVLGWQTSDGCLGYDDEEEDTAGECYRSPHLLTRAVKRESLSDSRQCDPHLMSMGMSALAFHLRVISFSYDDEQSYESES